MGKSWYAIMRVVNQKSINAVVNSASINGSAINASQLINASFQTINTDTDVAGTVKIQASNDLPPQGQLSPYTPTNWSDVPNATSAVVAGIGPVIILQNMAYQFVRAVFTKSVEGTGTMSVTMNAQGV